MRIHRLVLAPALVALSLVTACGDPYALPPASVTNSERVVILYAMSGTSLQAPSGFNLLNGIEVRTDRTPDFDFVVEFAPDSVLGLGTTGDTIVALLPRGAVGFAPDPGILISPLPWDSLKLAPTDGYTIDRAVAIDSGDVVVGKSRLQSCNFGLVRPMYAKIRIDQIDRTQRRIVTRIIANLNCGYRVLIPGLPLQ